MNIKLLGNRVLIDAGEAETKTQTGLIITKSKDASEFQAGIVVAVGPGKVLDDSGSTAFVKRCPMDVKQGDGVVFQYGKEIMVEGKPYQLVNQSDIIMVL